MGAGRTPARAGPCPGRAATERVRGAAGGWVRRRSFDYNLPAMLRTERAPARVSAVPRPGALVALVPLALVSTLYLALAGHQLDLPGLYADEALDLVPALQLLQGRPTDAVSSLRLFGVEWPLMVMDYVGPTSTYLSLPFLALGGPTVAAVRAYEISVGLLGLWVGYGLLAEVFDRRTAALAMLLTATSPSYVFWSRQGVHVSSPLLPLALGSAWALWRWRCERRSRYLVLGGGLLGLGLATKLLFLWWIVALLAAALALSWPGSPLAAWRPRRGARPALPGERAAARVLERVPPPAGLVRLGSAGRALASAGLAGCALVAGAFPLLWHNLQTGATVRLLTRNAIRTELYGVNNLDLPGNLVTVVRGFFAWLGGDVFFSFGGTYANPLAGPAFLGAVALLGWLARRCPDVVPARRLLLVLLLVGAVVFQSAFTITGLGPTHLYLLYGLPQALVAAAFWAAWGAWPGRAPRALAAGLAAALVALNLVAVGQYHAALARTGGTDLSSDAVSALAADLQRAGVARPVALDWGFRTSVKLLTAGAVDPEEAFEYRHEPSERFLELAKYLLGDPARRYLLHVEEAAAFRGHRAAFLQAVEETHRVALVERTYVRRDGAPVIEVLRAEPAPRRFDLPDGLTPVGARLGDVVELAGVELEGGPRRVARPGDTVRLRLVWRALRPPSQDYVVFTHLEGPGGRSAGQQDNDPVFGHYPTSRWLAGEVVVDPYRIVVRPEATPGTYRLLVGLYDRASGERLPAVDASGAPLPEQAVPLGVVEVGPDGSANGPSPGGS